MSVHIVIFTRSYSLENVQLSVYIGFIENMEDFMIKLGVLHVISRMLRFHSSSQIPTCHHMN